MSNTFNPKEHLITIKSKQGPSDYLPVKWRLVWFRQECPNGTIETEMVRLDVDKETEEEAFVWNSEKRRSEKVVKTARGLAIFHAVVTDGKGGSATATKMETAASFPDYLEKAETSAIGRALAALGYGTQFTADELDESNRIVDSPIERAPAPAPAPAPANGNTSNGTMTAQQINEESAASTITEQQIASIRKLCQYLSKPEPENVNALSFLAAKRLIQKFTVEYKEMRQQQQQNSKVS